MSLVLIAKIWRWIDPKIKRLSRKSRKTMWLVTTWVSIASNLYKKPCNKSKSISQWVQWRPWADRPSAWTTQPKLPMERETHHRLAATTYSAKLETLITRGIQAHSSRPWTAVAANNPSNQLSFKQLGSTSFFSQKPTTTKKRNLKEKALRIAKVMMIHKMTPSIWKRKWLLKSCASACSTHKTGSVSSR